MMNIGDLSLAHLFKLETLQHHKHKRKKRVQKFRCSSNLIFLLIFILCSCTGANAVIIADYNLVSLSSTQGFTMAYGGNAVSTAGDVNGDGVDDVIIGASWATWGTANTGITYVVFGKKNTVISNIVLTDFITGPSTGFRILAAAAGDYAGFAVSMAGDVNGDGVDDVITGSWGADVGPKTDAGIAYVIFGRRVTSPGNAFADIQLPRTVSMEANVGFRILGADTNDHNGQSVRGAGDINGDGIDDVIVGAMTADPPGLGTDNNAGIAYVVFGKNMTGNAAAFGDVDLAAISTLGFRILGAAANDQLGRGVSSAGDVNGDGLPDVIVGSLFADPPGLGVDNNGGISYVIFGRKVTSPANAFGDIQLPTTAMATSVGFRILGAGADHHCGAMVSEAGDVNADGVDDIMVGADWADPPALGADSNGGIVYVIFGRNVGNGGVAFSDIVLSTISTGSSLGFRILGAETASGLGLSLSSGSDINGDGVNDIIMGAEYSQSSSGVAYVIYGRKSIAGSIVFGDIALASMTSGSLIGFRIFGVSTNDRVGYSVSRAGDVNGDGVADIIVGTQLGSSYVIYGTPGSPTSQPSSQPSRQPSRQPTIQPTRQPSRQPTNQPSSRPSRQPTNQPSMQPTNQPTAQPTRQPSSQPSSQPSRNPTSQPSLQPSRQPSRQPTSQPSNQPSLLPSVQPSVQPSKQPTMQPSGHPSRQPTNQPSVKPSVSPTAQPSSQPSVQPTCQPSQQPTMQPTSVPSAQPSAQPSVSPSLQPSVQPSFQPTSQPSLQPSGQPSTGPSSQPSSQPSHLPSVQPSAQPSTVPSIQPSTQPSGIPTLQPSAQPSSFPSNQPSSQPSSQPTTQPSITPSTQPSTTPSVQPCVAPSMQPSIQPTIQSTTRPSVQPSTQPSMQPMSTPSAQPSTRPSLQPSTQPSTQPSVLPSKQPSSNPTMQPSVQPTHSPSMQPSGAPSTQPSTQPSLVPTIQPSEQPTSQPSVNPSNQPSRQPSSQPSLQPSEQPLSLPSATPTSLPSARPTVDPHIGSWVYVLESMSKISIAQNINNNVWVCGNQTGASCLGVDAVTGVLTTTYSFPWEETISTVPVGGLNHVVLSGTATSTQGIVDSDVASCSIEPTHQLSCAVRTYYDTSITAAAFVPFPNKVIHMGTVTSYVIASIASSAINLVSTTPTQNYVYTFKSMQSVAISHVLSPPNYVGAFFAGTCNSNTGAANYITAGVIRTDSGTMSAMYLTPASGTILNRADLVKALALEYEHPDTFIAGGLELSDGAGLNAYVLRVNAFFGSVKYCMRYRFRNSGRRTLSDSTALKSVTNGMVRVNSALYTILDLVQYNDHSSSISTSLAVLKIDMQTGLILQQVHILSAYASLSCSDITTSTDGSFIYLTCKANTESIMIASDLALNFAKLPIGFIRDTTSVLENEVVPFQRFSLPVTSKRTDMVTRDYLFSTTDGAPTLPPSVAPTVKPSAQPSSAPSGQPSSSPTAAPSVSPQPTSQPSSSGPTNTYKPTVKPTQRPSVTPTLRPTHLPTANPRIIPTRQPSRKASASPSAWPTVAPSIHPTRTPTIKSTLRPSSSPSWVATRSPTTVASTVVISSAVRSAGKSSDDAVMIFLYVLAVLTGTWIVYQGLKCCLQAQKVASRKSLVRSELDRIQQCIISTHHQHSHQLSSGKRKQQGAYINSPITRTEKDALPHTRPGAYATSPGKHGAVGSSSSSSIVLSSLHSSEMSDISYSVYSDDLYSGEYYTQSEHTTNRSEENVMEEGVIYDNSDNSGNDDRSDGASESVDNSEKRTNSDASDAYAASNGADSNSNAYSNSSISHGNSGGDDKLNESNDGQNNSVGSHSSAADEEECEERFSDEPGEGNV